MPEYLDILGVAAHPDDVELNAGGLLCLLAKAGYRTGILDLTKGELGSRGTPEERAREAAAASRILGLSFRENLGIPDGDIALTMENRLRLVDVLRRTRPHVVLTHPLACRHPDHTRAARLTIEACYSSGLARLRADQGRNMDPWRPRHLLHYAEVLPMDPTFVVDVTATWEQRMHAVRAFATQFHDPEQKGPETFISDPAFLRWVEARAIALGFSIGAGYGEGFIYRGTLGVADPMLLFSGLRPKPATGRPGGMKE